MVHEALGEHLPSGQAVSVAASPKLAASVVMVFDEIDPDRGSEQGIGWHWLTQMAGRVDRVTAVVPAAVAAALGGDHRVPSNVEIVHPDTTGLATGRLPLPPWYRAYAQFHQAADRLCASLPADLAHQVNLGTPFWGSAIGGFNGPRLLGPVGVSSPAPARVAATLGWREWRSEAARQALLNYPLRPVTWRHAMQAADHVLTVDRRSARMAERIGRASSPMLADGAEPLPLDRLVPVGLRRNLVWAGRFMPRKGAVLAIRAFARAVPRLPGDVRFTLIGDGTERDAAAAAAADTGVADRVDLVGRWSHGATMAAIGEARALVFSSIRDTFGGVVLEAAERGTPTVVALHDGVAGLQQSWPSTAGWSATARSARGIVSALADGMVAAFAATETEWQQSADAAHRFACEHDWDRRGAAMASRYRTLLDQGARS